MIIRNGIVLSMVVLGACAPQPIVAEPDDDEVHARVVAHANRAIDEALDDLSRALPPMNAFAERETSGEATGASAAREATSTLEETAAKPEQGDDVGNAKAKGSTGPRGVRPPLSASEAAERGRAPGLPTDGPTTATPPRRDVTPEAMSPTAPAETASPSR